MDLLQLLVDFGFDANNIDSPLFGLWPMPCSPDWFSEALAPDPFFIDYIAILVKTDPGTQTISARLTHSHNLLMVLYRICWNNAITRSNVNRNSRGC